MHGQDFLKREEDFFEFLASAASIVSCFGRTEGHTLDLCVKVVSLEFFTHTHRGAKEKKIRVRKKNRLLHNWGNLYNLIAADCFAGQISNI